VHFPSRRNGPAGAGIAVLLILVAHLAPLLAPYDPARQFDEGLSPAIMLAVFAWPGIGRMAVEATIKVDIPLIMGTVVCTALLVVVSSILIDLVQGIVDPRIRHH
jgi:ABC-type antimicrobial peptide transport system permease subunit